MIKIQRKWLIVSLITLAVLVAAGLTLAGIFFWIPRPLSLKPGEMIRCRVSFDTPGPYYVGDQVPVTLRIESREGVTYPPLDTLNPKFEKLEVKQRSPLTTTPLQGGKVEKLSFLVVAWEPGKYVFKRFAVPYKDPAGKEGTAHIPARTLKVMSLLPKDKTVSQLLKLDIKGVKGPVGLPPRLNILWWSLGAIALIALGWVLYSLLHKHLKKTSASGPDSVPAEPAHIIAMRRLEAIRTANYFESGDFKAFYSELSECVREYLENRFQIRALEMTTEEFLIHVSSNRCLQLEYGQILKEFMKFSDLVKFAKHLPLVEEAEHSLDIIRHFIETTKMAESVQTTEPGQAAQAPRPDPEMENTEVAATKQAGNESSEKTKAGSKNP